MQHKKNITSTLLTSLIAYYCSEIQNWQIVWLFANERHASRNLVYAGRVGREHVP